MIEEKFVIQGGNPLKGEIEVRGAKNAAFPVLAASLLTDETCVIENVPLIEDVFKMIKIMEGLGAKISWTGERKRESHPRRLRLTRASPIRPEGEHLIPHPATPEGYPPERRPPTGRLVVTYTPGVITSQRNR